MLTLNDGRSELWQWDTGRTLAVDADCSQVHFSNKVFGRSIDVDVVDGAAIIPDILLQTDKELNVWAFVGTAENGYTKISKTFKVNRRNKPADYVFTPPEQTTLAELSGRIDRIEESQDPDAIKNAVADYISKNPITVEETDPTVPAWAKQPEKPAYTAAEVHALPDTYTPPVDAALSETSTNPVQNKVVAAKLSEVESIAKGRATGHVFETETDMRTWIASNASALNLGDNLYIRATDVPDYWWDGTSAQPMETQKVDLTEYAKKSEVPAVDTTLTQSGQAADAAAVGEQISSLSEEIAKIPGGADGKSAYQYAQDGGYTGTETEFAAKLAQEKFANPNALNFTGAVNATYDGSAAVSVEIPSAVTDDHINSMIDTKLGVIENGAY